MMFFLLNFQLDFFINLTFTCSVKHFIQWHSFNISKYTMKHQPKSKKHRNKRHKIYPGKPSWGRKPNNFFGIDSIANDTMPIQMPKRKTLDAKTKPQCQALATKQAFSKSVKPQPREAPRRCATCESSSPKCDVNNEKWRGASSPFYMILPLKYSFYINYNCQVSLGASSLNITYFIPGRPLLGTITNHLADLFDWNCPHGRLYIFQAYKLPLQ